MTQQAIIVNDHHYAWAADADDLAAALLSAGYTLSGARVAGMYEYLTDPEYDGEPGDYCDPYTEMCQDCQPIAGEGSSVDLTDEHWDTWPEMALDAGRWRAPWALVEAMRAAAQGATIDFIPDAEAARLYLEARRWNGRPDACPLCGGTERISARGGKRVGYYRCGDCRGEFTVRTGTIFERSHVPLDKWIYAIARKGVSSLQLSKEIGVTQKTAWFMLGRLREACGGDTERLSGVVEALDRMIDRVLKHRPARAEKRLQKAREKTDARESSK